MRWSCELSLAALWVLALSLSAAYALPPTQTPEVSRTPISASTQIGSEYQSRQYDQNDAAHYVPIAGQIGSAQAKSEREQFNQQIRIQGRVANFTKALVIVGVLQFLAALIYSGVAWRQLYQMKKQARIARVMLTANRAALRVGRKGSDAAKQAATAAEQNADTAKRALEMANRPWLVFQNPIIDSANPSEVPFRTSYELRNIGNSPAWINRLLVRFKYVKSLPIKPDTDHITIDGLPEYLSHEETISKGETLTKFCSIGIMDDISDPQAFFAGKKFLALYGIVEYEDSFKNPHKTGFCWTYEVNPMLVAIAGLNTPYWRFNQGPPSYYFRD